MPRRKVDLTPLEERLGYRFSAADLLSCALTHVSADAGLSYQRLEFLGDRVLGLAIADLLLAAFPHATEGDLSRRLSELVRKETCAEVAESWDVGPYLRLGKGSSGGSALRRNRSVLADACEAIIGAVFLDGGFPPARALVENAFGERIHALAHPPSNPKATLQEWALGRGLPIPAYDVFERLGPDHAPKFRIKVAVQGLEPAIGAGESKRGAEQNAAEALLMREGIWKVPADGR